LGEGLGKRDIVVVLAAQALSPTLSLREREFEYSDRWLMQTLYFDCFGPIDVKVANSSNRVAGRDA
jgi:hypothetical protein